MTKIQLDLSSGLTPDFAYLYITESGQASPDPSYNIDTYSVSEYVYTIDVSGLEGIYRISARNPSSGQIFHGYAGLFDNSATYIANSDYNYVASQYLLYRLTNDLNNTSPNYNFSTASVPIIYKQSINIFKGTDWNFNISGIGSDAENFYFTIKSDKNLQDSNSELQISKSGVIIINGIDYGIIPSGELTYSSDNGGSVVVSIDPEVTSLIDSENRYFWDVKGVNEDTIRSFGTISIREDVTNRYS